MDYARPRHCCVSTYYLFLLHFVRSLSGFVRRPRAQLPKAHTKKGGIICGLVSIVSYTLFVLASVQSTPYTNEEPGPYSAPTLAAGNGPSRSLLPSAQGQQAAAAVLVETGAAAAVEPPAVGTLARPTASRAAARSGGGGGMRQPRGGSQTSGGSYSDVRYTASMRAWPL